ncbi:hypothetical protein E3P77_01533 [Wallemia ichthyophaga]|uniref:DNA 5'-3' helicase n=1 Tax=Wallemia ichthyophaga TaxID=245174 RepID=A0A4T0HFY8_WALIC|nr:hypothetical protein E3P90_01768 [Wallemia ichthyophaga]TIB14664.1 hypothetical protein E3P93_01518 [Wallemia ichthyophaga]TIB23687.1 hypothetical protein E3P89_01368 [Wallemia ichthyophaga]TIB25074.1 hypothetical protein E3P88_01723 [Wallemia ichthyophaga]TIB67401.1 hypothetical protein E3P77_01533 [Wallemia ichthyophaga]
MNEFKEVNEVKEVNDFNEFNSGDLQHSDEDFDNEFDNDTLPNIPGKKGRKLGAKYSLIPQGSQNIDINMNKRKRQAPLPFNSSVNNAIASSSKVTSRTRPPKADPYRPQIPAPDFAKPDYSHVEELFEPFIKKQLELQDQGQTPPPVKFPVNQRPDYVVSSAPRIPQNYIVPVPLDTHSKSNYKTRRWSEHTKHIRSLSGSTLRLKSWLGSQHSEYSNRPPPLIPTTTTNSNQGFEESINPANIITPSGVPLNKLDKRTREYKMIMAQHKSQLEQKRMDQQRQKIDDNHQSGVGGLANSGGVNSGANSVDNTVDNIVDSVIEKKEDDDTVDIADNSETVDNADNPETADNVYNPEKTEISVFYLDDLPVCFPYDRIYPEQYSYMRDLKKTLDAGGHCVLEMPSGTGKTVSLLSLIVAYQQHYDADRKLVYCSRTVPEIEKALAELKRLMAYRADQGYAAKDSGYTGLGLSSRKNLCLHPSISQERRGKAVDARCRDLTSAHAVQRGRDDPSSHELCSYHENLSELAPGEIIPPGIWTIEDVRKFGQQKGLCPYFSVRRMVQFCNTIIYSFHYLLDPKVAEMVSREMSKDAIVVFDEAHNIDNVCIESLSIDLTRPMLESASRSVDRLSDKISEAKQNDAQRLQDEYAKLVEGMQDSDAPPPNDEMAMIRRQEEDVLSNPVLPDDLLKEAIPGNIRKAEHFIAFLKRFVEYLKTRMRVLHVVAETPLSFLQHLRDITFIERKPLRFCSDRLSNLIKTLELERLDEYSSLQSVAAFATLVSTYEKGFLLILEPFETETATIPNPIFHLTCQDASIAIAPVFDRFSSVIITSGTISPLDMYPKMLNFNAIVQESYPMTLSRNCFIPMVITRGSDQVAVSSRFEVRNDPAVVRNYGQMLIEYSKVIPDGIVAFFPSYLYMESIVSAWNEMQILDEVWKHKLIFVETPDAPETSIALENFRKACDNGRGAVMLSVARGKVSEGIDFDHHFGRAVIMFGVPYQYTESRILKARLEYLRDNHRIRESDFLTFDAMRHAAQCVGRVLRGKSDYGLMIFADKRFARSDKRAKLPRWINQYIAETSSNLSTDMAISLAKRFVRTMAQPFDHSQTGVSLWTMDHVLERQRLDKESDLAAVALTDKDHMNVDGVVDGVADGVGDSSGDSDIDDTGGIDDNALIDIPMTQ